VAGIRRLIALAIVALGCVLSPLDAHAEHKATCDINAATKSACMAHQSVITRLSQGWTSANGTCGNFNPTRQAVILANNTSRLACGYLADDTPQCEEGGSPFHGSFAGDSEVGCVDGCTMECTGQDCISYNLGEGWRTYGDWEQTGQTCGQGEPDPDPEPGGCQELGTSGFTFCEEDNPGCVRSPAGAMLCPNIPGPDCATSPSGAACSNSSPPEGYDPPQSYTICPSTGCVPISVAPPSDDDEEEEDEPDCPANDPDCEEDEDDVCPEGQVGTPPDCEPEENGICVEDNQTVCDILRDIRTATQAVASDTHLQLKEDRETNFKLAELKDQLEHDAEEALKATNRVHVATDTVRTAVNASANTVANATSNAASSVSSAVTSSSASVTAAVNANSAKLDSLTTAVNNSSTCGGVGEPACDNGGGGDNSDIVDAVNAPDWLNTNPGIAAGDGATQADTDAATLQTLDIGVGDIDESGFGLGGACPVFPQLTVGGAAWDIDTVFWCDFLDIVKAVLLLAGAWAAAQILMGK